MFKNVKNSLSKAAKSRTIVLIIVFLILSGVLIQRLFTLQIINGESYQNDFTMKIKKEREIKSTRGNIFDRNGNLLAYNELAYSVTFEDNGSYETTRERNLTLNGYMYGLMKIIEQNEDSISSNFKIKMDGAGNYTYTVSGTSLLRFKADIYGRAYIDDLTAEQRIITAEELMKYLCEDKFGVVDSSYTKEELEAYGLPETLTDEEVLKITSLRNAIAENSYQKYVATTIAKNVSKETAAQILENQGKYSGVDIQEDSIRVYNDSIYFAPLIGYTGTISAEELETLSQENSSYNVSDIVGKVGLESYFETTLQGTKGEETLFVDNLGKTLSVDSKTEPVSGDNVYLTIDKDLQIAAYNILEQYIAGIVYANIIDTEVFDTNSISSVDDIKIPLYDVYYALFENNVLDVSHLAASDATGVEQRVYQAFLQKESSIFSEIKANLTVETPPAYKDLTEEMQVYMSYVVNNMLTDGTGVLNMDAVDKTDKTYLAWSQDESISLQTFLTYAIEQNWIDISKIPMDNDYADSNEIYNALSDYIAGYLANDVNFSKKVFRYMLQEGSLSGTDVCLLLFDQGILAKNDSDYQSLSDGTISSYDFIRAKIYDLEITPAQLALDPCSGSVVIVDPNNGDVLACVTYPGYDNNLLANEMDSNYYSKMVSDLSSPFYNKATQERTAPGSTFKVVTAIAGVMENVISVDEQIECTGLFDLVNPEIRCWIYPGNHGKETLENAIADSCNFFFNTVGYRLSMVYDGVLDETGEDGEPVDEVGVEKLAKYASMFGLNETTGIEIGESSPIVSDMDSVRSAMGQANNAYTTTQLARYVATIANQGTCYDLTMVENIKNSNGDILKQDDPVVHSTIDIPEYLWNTVRSGMNKVVKNNSAMQDLTGIEMAGKTGTAQESTVRPSHALFIGYAPYDNPQIAMAVRITNGYTSANAASVAKDVVNYYFNLKPKDELINGTAKEVISDQTSQTD